MDILYMGYYCNEDLFNELVECGSQGSHARQQFERKLLDGISQNMKGHSFKMVSYLPLIDDKFAERKGEDYKGYPITYLWCKKKITGILRCIRQNKKHIKEWARNAGEDKIILTYSANPLHCIPAMNLRRKYGYKIVTISSEISIHRRQTKRNPLTWLKTKVTYYLENNFDGYVLLSKYMGELVNKKNNPYTVVEGFGEVLKRPETANKDRKKAILYAGGLSEDNGIQILVDGFRNFDNSDWELWICGGGKLEDYVKQQGIEDNRIKFYGVVPNEQVVKMEFEASYLINPRFSGEDYTKYSFPSKTLEYMSTGTPTIITRLKGIPEEYFEYAIILEEETTMGVTKLLNELEKTPYEIYENRAKKALENIILKKTTVVQGERILLFLANMMQ